MRQIFRLAGRYIQAFKWQIAFLVTLSMFAGLVSIATPYITGDFIDFLISPTATIKGLIHYCLIFLAVSLASIVTNYVSKMSLVKVSTSMGYRLNSDVLAHVHTLSFDFVKDSNAASLTQKINNDSNQLVIFTLNVLCNIAVNALKCIVPFVVLLGINAWIAAVVLIFGAAYVITYLYMRQRLYRAGYDYKEAQSAFFGHLNDQLRFFKFIKDNSIASVMLARLNVAFSEILSKTITFQRVSYVFNSLDGLIVTLSQIAIFIFGGALVILQDISVGDFTILNSYVSIVLTSMRYFFSLGQDTQNTIVCHDRLMQMLSKKAEVNGKTPLIKPVLIDLNDLSYARDGQTIFSNLSYSFKVGNLYAIVGANGCGKTTLANLLLGENQVEYVSGSIAFDGISWETLNMSHARRWMIGYCEQEPVIFNDTFRFNLTLGNEVDDDYLNEVLEILDLHAVVCNYANGIETVVSSASGLSGGEKQRIAIARILLGNKPIMLFDEPTSAMDGLNKRNFVEHMRKIKTEKIVIVITHDHDILSAFDQVLSMESLRDYDNSKI